MRETYEQAESVVRDYLVKDFLPLSTLCVTRKK